MKEGWQGGWMSDDGAKQHTQMRKNSEWMDTLGRSGSVTHVWVVLYSACFLHCYSLCMGTAGVCGGEGAVRTAGGGVLDLPSPSEEGPEPLRTELSRSANFVAAGFRREG